MVLKAAFRGKVTTDDLTTFAKSVMAIYKVPRVIEFVEMLPRSGSNKVDWRSLQDAERDGRA